MSSKDFREMEARELINKLRVAHPEVVDLLLYSDHGSTGVYTKKGRIKKSAVARATGLKGSVVERIIADMRSILEKDY